MDTTIYRKHKAIEFSDKTEDGKDLYLKVHKLSDENGGILFTMKSVFYDGDDKKSIFGQIALSKEEAEDLMLELSDMLHFCESKPKRDVDESRVN